MFKAAFPRYYAKYKKAFAVGVWYREDKEPFLGRALVEKPQVGLHQDGLDEGPALIFSCGQYKRGNLCLPQLNTLLQWVSSLLLNSTDHPFFQIVKSSLNNKQSNINHWESKQSLSPRFATCSGPVANFNASTREQRNPYLLHLGKHWHPLQSKLEKVVRSYCGIPSAPSGEKGYIRYHWLHLQRGQYSSKIIFLGFTGIHNDPR